MARQQIDIEYTTVRQRVDNGYQNCAEIADYARISEWAKLDLQSIQHRDYFGHLSIYTISLESFRSIRGPLFRKPVTGQELFLLLFTANRL